MFFSWSCILLWIHWMESYASYFRSCFITNFSGWYTPYAELLDDNSLIVDTMHVPFLWILLLSILSLSFVSLLVWKVHLLFLCLYLAMCTPKSLLFCGSSSLAYRPRLALNSEILYSLSASWVLGLRCAPPCLAKVLILPMISMSRSESILNNILCH